MEDKPIKLKLKAAWFKNILGLAVDQVTINQTYSLTPYYFWPRTEALEQLKLELDSKTWLTQEEIIKILETAGEVMNYWLSYRNTTTINRLKKDFQEVDVIMLNE